MNPLYQHTKIVNSPGFVSLEVGMHDYVATFSTRSETVEAHRMLLEVLEYLEEHAPHLKVRLRNCCLSVLLPDDSGFTRWNAQVAITSALYAVCDDGVPDLSVKATVASSSAANREYAVTYYDSEWHCECKSWQYRSSCRHVDEVKDSLK